MNKNPNHKQSFRNALAGLVAAYKTERNFRVMFLLAVLILVAGFFFQLSLLEMAIIVWAIFAVIAVEMINTSLESITDLVEEEWHEKAGRAKDIAAGMVLLASVGAAVVGMLIFGPKVISLIIP